MSNLVSPCCGAAACVDNVSGDLKCAACGGCLAINPHDWLSVHATGCTCPEIAPGKPGAFGPWRQRSTVCAVHGASKRDRQGWRKHYEAGDVVEFPDGTQATIEVAGEYVFSDGSRPILVRETPPDDHQTKGAAE